MKYFYNKLKDRKTLKFKTSEEYYQEELKAA